MLEIIYHFNLILDQWRHCCSVSWNLGPRIVAVTICGQYAVSRRRPDIAPAFWTDDLLNYFNNRIVAAKMLPWSMSDSNTWLLSCWHWVRHVPRAASGSRVTRGLGNTRGISWCHHDQDPGGWLESEEGLTTISMSRVYIGDQEFTLQEWRRRGVLSTRHSNTSRQFAEYH